MMAVFKRGRYYHFEFVKGGVRYQRSTRQRNFKAAGEIEKAFQTALAKADVGIIERRNVPTLKAFEKTFGTWIDENKRNARTREFYKCAYKKLVAFPVLGGTRLDFIDEAAIEKFKTKMLAHDLSKTTINRYLATLRKALRYASRKLKLFDKLPVIEMYSQEDGAERQRKFIFSDDDYKNWLAIAPEPLRAASILARAAGICRAEMLALQRDCVTLNDDTDEDGLFGRLEIKRGLKRKERERTLPVTADMRDALAGLLAQSRCQYVFTALEDRAQPLSPYTLEHQLLRTRTTLKLDADAGLHALRHTFLTEMARKTDPFTLQKIAGHARITTTQRYIHAQQAAITAAFATWETAPTKLPAMSSREKQTGRI